MLTSDRHRQEDHGQTGEDDGLNETHQQLQAEHELDRHEGHQEGDHHHQDLPGRHVPKQPERKAHHPHQLADPLKETDEDVNQPGRSAPEKVSKSKNVWNNHQSGSDENKLQSGVPSGEF